MTEKQKTRLFCPECGDEFDTASLDHCPNDGVRLRELPGLDAGDPLLGEVLDERFRVESVLGEGGMGRVYLGEQLSVERPVAIKTMRPEAEAKDVLIKRFMRESRVISQLSHPNIVRLVDFGRDGEHGILYLVLELVDGVGADTLLDGHRWAPAFAVHVAGQICGGLSAAHDAGVVHRDLKPSNVMLVPLSEGRLESKILDFGVAHAVHETSSLTETGDVWGTPHYMAPEQARGTREVGPATDIYALGIMLFEMLTGHVPVDGETTLEILFAHVEQELPDIRNWLPADAVPDRLVALIEEMTAKEPEARPDSVVTVRQELQAITRDAGWSPINVSPGLPLAEMFDEWLESPVERSSEATDIPSPDTDAPAAIHETGEGREEGVALAETLAQESEPAVEEASGDDGESKQPQEPVASDRPDDETQKSSGAPAVMIGVGVLAAIAIAAGFALNATDSGRTPATAEEPDAGPSGSVVRIPDALQCLQSGYASHIRRVEPRTGDAGATRLVVTMKGGESFVWDRPGELSGDEKLDDPDLAQMFAQPYPLGEPDGEPDDGHDPGRYRHAGFLQSVYGDSAESVSKQLVDVAWPGEGKDASVAFNRQNGADQALRRVRDDLKALPGEYDKYFEKTSGSFNWRTVKGTDRLSAHAYGIAIDLNIEFADYWRWREDKDSPPYRNRMPWEVVEVFERHGFIWGGKWYHYDTAHFEYRPELTKAGCAQM